MGPDEKAGPGSDLFEGELEPLDEKDYRQIHFEFPKYTLRNYSRTLNAKRR
jgi:hypothetical protein